MKVEYYVLDDGRIWSVMESTFVSDVPAGSFSSRCPDEQGNSTLEGLLDCLHFYGCDLGELKTDEEYASEARSKRNALLAETDYLMMTDYPISEERKSVMLAYRQMLRDISLQPGFPRQIEWPVKP